MLDNFFTKVKQLEAIENAENNMGRVCDKRGQCLRRIETTKKILLTTKERQL